MYLNCIRSGIGIDIDISASSFYTGSQFPFSRAIQSKIDSAIALSIDYHVIEAYRYLINIYQPDDKIFLFGFSRGSFIARILAGMIEKIGLLDKGLEGLVKTAWEIYRDWEKVGQPKRVQCTGFLKLFKQTFCRHAVSLHERRSKFKQNLFIPHSYLPHFLERNCSCESLIDHVDDDANSPAFSAIPFPEEDSVTRSHHVSLKFSYGCSNDLLELWFSGDHSDIGGNWPFDENGTKISVLPLRWILSFAIEYGVMFKQNAIQEFNMKFTPLRSCLAYQHDILSFKGHTYPDYVSGYCEPENDERYDSQDPSNLETGFGITTAHDSYIEDGSPILKSPIFPNFQKYWKSTSLEVFEANKGHGNNSLLFTLFWWILEIFPIGYMVENKEGKWRPLYWPNLGEKRNLPHYAKLHWSLLWRLKFTNDVDFSHLPKIYSNLQKIIDADEISSSSALTGSDKIVIRLDDIVDFKSGMIKTDFENFLLKANHSKKNISLEIDWSDPPNELDSYINQS
ncbi:hypothetical protein CANINC_001819 [Pichia inconspicua]|uniref:T6SS Phospholipase effector Tle1-like catalytic domain-containing protein n=1 Tax=Pichia inconspicua TaxID=52247 RepID=A0A4T0X319_9ASCO|nr:hypothetical protein CANINC_001819 [[Candida] inconspicua]